MQLNTIPKTIATSLMLASSAQATYEIACFQDRDCTVPVTGSGKTQVLSGTCDANVKGGYSSIKVLHKWNSPAGTLTFYETGSCFSGFGKRKISFGDPSIGACHDFGWVANSVYLFG
ncbi:hypothetical protein F5Y18DRAFT_421464 [Xylariaceae sp. FL1019]|nr:hypothetical protein F5Y18DRAFT_421464 [Xylariaceae sp. FL1019]